MVVLGDSNKQINDAVSNGETIGADIVLLKLSSVSILF